MKRINVRITFLEEVLGTASANEELHATYIASKAPDAKSKEEEVEALGVANIVPPPFSEEGGIKIRNECGITVLRSKKMEFDKSKILTVVTADQAKVGQKGWFASNIETLSCLVLEEQPKELLGFDSNNAVHAFRTSFQNHALFYPVPEPTYAERQAEWVKENGVKEGTKVRVTRKWSYMEECCCIGCGPKKKVFIGDKTCTVGHVDDREGNAGIAVYSAEEDDWWYFPYFVLEVIREPTYRPYNNDELNDLVGEILTNKKSGRRKLVTGKPTASQGVNLDGSYITAKDLLSSFYRNTNEPCGIKEE